VGSAVGLVGETVGATVGLVGETVGSAVGLVGETVGPADGISVGAKEGDGDGSLVGLAVGSLVGTSVGAEVVDAANCNHTACITMNTIKNLLKAIILGFDSFVSEINGTNFKKINPKTEKRTSERDN
jgi:hypothetical protein